MEVALQSMTRPGTSLGLARVTSPILDLPHLRAGGTVSLAVDGGRLVDEPQSPPRYTLDALLAQCDASAEPMAEERDWLDAAPAGDELL
jgi:antitoxin ChpS